MRNFFIFIFLSLIPQVSADWDSFSYYPPMDLVYHPVSTNNPEAQKTFNSGLLAIYAFNHDAAYRIFEETAKIDPNLAMAYWGMALALGETINTPITEKRQKEAFAWIQKAQTLLKGATENEKDYIRALAMRYSNQPNPDLSLLRNNYAKAMKSVVAAYPDDLDAATLFAESMLDLRPWSQWANDGTPAEGTLEMVALLESVLKRNPEHLGANHYYIHVMEASKHPERALMSAYRLTDLLPQWGHILHMPSHIYILVGDYQKAVEANTKAVAADKKYIEQYGIQGYYPLHYMSHNLYFLCRGYLWQERYEEALGAANELFAFLSPHIGRMEDLEYYLLAPLQVNLYFHRWNAILNIPRPSEHLKGVTAFWHFARAMAQVSLRDFHQAEQEKMLFRKQIALIPEDQRLGYNRSRQVLAVALDLLTARFAKARGDLSESLKNLRAAVAKQDTLRYNEPPDWYYPIRQTLGALLLEMEQPQEAEGVFREALERLPRNGRSLFGLLESLRAQQKFDYWVERETNEALHHSKNLLTLKDL